MAKLLKELYNENYIDILSDNIKNSYDDFNKNNFKILIFDKKWKNRELKQRMRHYNVPTKTNHLTQHSYFHNL